MVAKALGLTRLDLYLQFDRPLTQGERDQVRELLLRRRNREPLSYILGEAHFWNLVLKVGPGVLSPRSDTECLIELAQPLLPKEPQEPNYRILELGAGSLAITLALAQEGKGMELQSLECSSEALIYAQENLAKYQEDLAGRENRIKVTQSLGFAEADEGLVDLIVSNPPYIPQGEIEGLMKEVVQYEPALALDGGAEGLDFYPLLATEAQRRLKRGGHLLFEHGYDQRPALLELMKNYEQLQLIEARDDYGGNPRAMLWQKI